MAYWWHSQVSFHTEEDAAKFLDTYDTSEFQVPHTGTCSVGCSRESTDEDRKQYIEVTVMPSCATDHGGAANQEEADDQNAAARVFYDRLRGHTFAFALTDVEVGLWRTPAGLLEDLCPGGHLRGSDDHGSSMGGLVISNAMFEAAEQPPDFVVFDGDHVWVPWVDEIVRKSFRDVSRFERIAGRTVPAWSIARSPLVGAKSGGMYTTPAVEIYEVPSMDGPARITGLLRQEWMPTFVEVSPTPAWFDKPRDERDQARSWAIFGRRALQVDPFELDRWADDGGPAIDHW